MKSIFVPENQGRRLIRLVFIEPHKEEVDFDGYYTVISEIAGWWVDQSAPECGAWPVLCGDSYHPLSHHPGLPGDIAHALVLASGKVVEFEGEFSDSPLYNVNAWTSARAAHHRANGSMLALKE